MSLRDHDKTAHYLHERSGLEAVLRPPVSDPTCVRWVPRREELIVGTASGTLVAVDPVMGTTHKAEELGHIVGLSLHPDRKRFAVVTRDGEWIAGDLGGEVRFRGPHEFVGAMGIFWLGDALIAYGDRETDRAVYVISRDGFHGATVPVPWGAVPMANGEGRLALARSTPRGLSVQPLARRGVPEDDQATAHKLVAYSDKVLGTTEVGGVVWDVATGNTASIRYPDIVVGTLNNDRSLMGFGTRHGSVGLAKMDEAASRAKPYLVKSGGGPILGVSFSTRGRWLATAGDHVILWSWEMDDEED